jgi:hypothetical protein
MFEGFKSLLLQLIDDPDVVRKNSLLSDDSYRSDLKSRVSALTPDISLRQDYSNALSPTSGSLLKNERERKIQFIPKGFSTYLSAFREGVVDTPAKLYRIPDEAESNGRYFYVDRGSGVLYLNGALESYGRFPGYGPMGATNYDDPSAICVWQDSVTDIWYVAIATYSHHVVQIYELLDPYTHIATIGVLDTPDSISGYCYNPRGLAYDSNSGYLYILNERGQPPGSTLDRGYIARYDVSTPATPTFVDNPWYYVTDGSLLSGEILTASDIFIEPDGSKLWVTNGNDEAGAFDLTATTPTTLSRYIEPSGSGYTLRGPDQIYVYTLLGGYKRIYVVNSNTGVIDEFDALNLTHLASYGYRASEDELNGWNRLSDSIYGALGQPTSVLADRVFVDDQEIEVLIVGDALNKRLHRFNLNSYQESNFVNFELMELDVPISVNGWTLNGTVPLDLVRVFYRTSETDQFQELPVEANTQASSTWQFRVEVRLKPDQFISTWDIHSLRINAVQA